MIRIWNAFRKGIFLAAAAAVLCLADGQTALAEEPFSIKVTDAQGIVTNGYAAPQDGIVYLFLPSSVDIPDLRVQCTGSIQGVTTGTYDAKDKVITGAFKKSGDAVIVHLAEGDVQVKVMQSSLPSIQIQLNGTTLQKVWENKDKKYAGNSLYLTDPAGNDLTAVHSVELKGRGNSSWREFEKKPYQIKFSEKTSLLGMPAAKKWVLLANAGDDSLMRNAVAFDMAKKLDMPFTPSFCYADLWIDGNYQGNYMITDKIEIGSSRVKLKDEYGVLMEQDASFYAEEDYWFYDTLLDTHFTVKESVEEKDKDKIRSAMTQFNQALDIFVDYLYHTPAEQVTLEALATMIDVDSFAKYYLITEYTLNREANHTSYYWYRDGAGDVLHVGPVWDYDTCMGNEDLGPEQYYAGVNNVLMNHLLACPAFYNRVKALKSRYDQALKGAVASVDTYNRKIADSAAMNYVRWNTLGAVNPKGFGNYAGTYSEAVSALRKWLSGRYGLFAPQQTLLTVAPSEDGGQLTVYSQKSGVNLSIAFWSGKGNQEDLQWFPADGTENGKTVFHVDMTPYQSEGMYFIHLYDVKEGGSTLLSGTTFLKQ